MRPKGGLSAVDPAARPSKANPNPGTATVLEPCLLNFVVRPLIVSLDADYRTTTGLVRSHVLKAGNDRFVMEVPAPRSKM